MIEENRPPYRQNDNFFVGFREQCALDLNNPCTTDGHDSIRFPIEPLRSSLSHGQMKRIDTHSSDWGNISPLASSRTPVLSPANPTETSTPHPSTSQHVQVAQPSPQGLCSPIQQYIRNSAKLGTKLPKYNRSQPLHPDFQAVLTTLKRQGYKLWFLL